MALIKGKLIDPSTAIRQSSDPVSNEDLARKGYVDSKASAEADAAELAAKSYADQKISDLVNGAPAMLDTLKELADALEAGDAQLSQEILTQIGLVDDKIDQEILDRQSAVSSEASARQLADQGLQEAIDDEQSRAEGEEARIEGKIDQEILDRQSADSALDSRLDVLEGADTVEGSVAKALKDAKAYTDSEVSSEESRAMSAESALDERIDVLEQDPTTKTYVDGKFADANSYTDQKVSDLVNGAPAMLDTLKELADAIESQGGSLTTEILNQVGAVDDRVDQEILDRQAGDTNLQNQINEVVSDLTQEISDRQSAISSEQSARELADSQLDSRLDVLEGADTVEGSVAKAEKDAKDYADSKFSEEQSRAQGEESRIEGKVDQEILDRQSAVSAEQSAREAADSALDARLDTLEAAPSPKGRKEVKTMSATDISNGYVDLSYEAMPKSMFVSVSGTVQYEDEDYTVSTVGGVSRITFTGDLTPDGDGAALVEGDKVHFQYFVMSTEEQSTSSGGGGSSGGGSSGGGSSGGGSSIATGVTWEALGDGDTELLSGVTSIVEEELEGGFLVYRINFSGNYTSVPSYMSTQADWNQDGILNDGWWSNVDGYSPSINKSDITKTHWFRVQNGYTNVMSQLIKVVIP